MIKTEVKSRLLTTTVHSNLNYLKAIHKRMGLKKIQKYAKNLMKLYFMIAKSTLNCVYTYVQLDT